MPDERRGMGRGPRGDPAPGSEGRGGPARAARRAGQAQSPPATAGVRRAALAELASRSARAGCSSRSWCACCPVATTSSWPASGACARHGSRSSSLSRRWCARRTTGAARPRARGEHGRVDLNAIEEARACAMLVDDLGLTKEEVGRRVGRSRVAISNLIRLLELPDQALELVETERLSEGHGQRGRFPLSARTRHAAAARVRRPRRCLVPVRETERRAREAETGSTEPPRPRAVGHPDLAAALAAAEMRDRQRSAATCGSGRGAIAAGPSSSSTPPPRPSSWPSKFSRAPPPSRLGRASGHRYNRPARAISSAG